MIYPVILAGGSGTRLWPMSRSLYPKQLINLYNAHTMLQNTLLRLSGLNDLGDPVVICNEDHRFMTAEQIRRIDINNFKIILEPAARNTAPAIALAALILDDNLKSEHQDDPVMLVLPADHEIKNIEAFHEIIQSGAQLARQGKLSTFGIVSASP